MTDYIDIQRSFRAGQFGWRRLLGRALIAKALIATATLRVIHFISN